MFALAADGPIPAINLDDVRLRARRRLPRVLFDLIDGGSEGEATRNANESQYTRYSLLPRQAFPVQPNTRIDLFGHEFSMPVLLAPCRSEEHTSELQSLMRISYAVFCLKKKTTNIIR